MNSRALLIVFVLISQRVMAVEREAGGSVQIYGKEYGLQESIPLISKLLKSRNKAEKLQGLDFAHYWGWELSGSDLVAQILGMYDSEKDIRIKRVILFSLGSISDGRALRLYKEAAESNDDISRFLGLLGRTDLEGPVVFPQLVEAMLNSRNDILIKEVIGVQWRLLQGDFDIPPAEAWTSDVARKRYLQEFSAWWRQNKDRLIAQWKAEYQSAPTLQTSTNQPVPIKPPATTSLEPQRQIEKTRQPAAQPPATTVTQAPQKPATKNIAKLIAAAVAVLVLLGALFWLARRK